LLQFSNSSHRIVGKSFTPFEDALRKRLLAVHEPGSNELHEVALLGNELAHIYARAVRELLVETNTASALVQAIGVMARPSGIVRTRDTPSNSATAHCSRN
jgi:anhydro-N-acetylmuramic acid kinase